MGESDLSSGATRHMHVSSSIWLLSYSVSFRSYVMSVVVCTCVCSCLKVRQSSILGPSAVQAVQTWRIGLPTETSPLSTHLFPTSPYTRLSAERAQVLAPHPCLRLMKAPNELRVPFYFTKSANHTHTAPLSTHDCRQKELNSWHLTLACVS